MSRTPSASIHIAECRDTFIEALRGGSSRQEASVAIDCAYRTVQRYIAGNPGFRAKCELAEMGMPTRGEAGPEPEPAPVSLARVVHEGEPVDSVPCDSVTSGPQVWRKPTPEEHDHALAIVNANPDHRHWGKAAEILERRFHGAELVRALKMVERELAALPEGDKPHRVLVIRVPDNGTRGKG